VAKAIAHAARHYTLEGKLHKGSVPSLQAVSASSQRAAVSEKQIVEMKISHYDVKPACV
jgi:hypothetical protein